METATLVVTIVSAFFSGIQAFWATYPFFSKKTALQLMTQRIQNMKPKTGKKTLKLAVASDEHREYLVEWLENGRILLQAMLRRVTVRLSMLIVGCVAVSACIPYDADGAIAGWLPKSLEIHDIGIFLFVTVIPWVAKNSQLFITEREKKFLKQLADLENAYYMLIIEPAMDTFGEQYRLYFGQYAFIRQADAAQVKQILPQGGANADEADDGEEG